MRAKVKRRASLDDFMLYPSQRSSRQLKDAEGGVHDRFPRGKEEEEQLWFGEAKVHKRSFAWCMHHCTWQPSLPQPLPKNSTSSLALSCVCLVTSGHRAVFARLRRHVAWGSHHPSATLLKVPRQAEINDHNVPGSRFGNPSTSKPATLAT